MSRARVEPKNVELDRPTAIEPGLEQINTSPNLRSAAIEGLVLDRMLESRETLTRSVAGFFRDLGITEDLEFAKDFVTGLFGSAKREMLGATGYNNSEEGLTPIPVESKVRDFRTLGNDE